MAGSRRSSSRRGPASRACARRPSWMRPATRTCARSRASATRRRASSIPAQTLTTTFRMANVDLDRRRAIPKAEFHRLMAEAAESGDYDLPRREGSDHITPVDGVTATIMTRLDSVRRDADGRLVNATDPWFLTEAEIAGRRQALEYVRFLVDRVPGYERASLVALGTQIGVRETRRVYGDYRLDPRRRPGRARLRRRDRPVRRADRGPPRRRGHGLAVPAGRRRRSASRIGSLVVRDAANVLVAGRCFSATHDAHASVRSMAQCMAMGQAAGTAAALSVAGRRDPRDIDVERPARSTARRRRDPGARRRARGGRAMTFVRTVLGDIAPEELGVTYAHEHLVIDGGRPVELEPEFDLGDVEAMATEVAEAAGARAALGGRCHAVRRRPQRRQARGHLEADRRPGRRAYRAASRPLLRPGALEPPGLGRGARRPVHRRRRPTASMPTTTPGRSCAGPRSVPGSSRSPAPRAGCRPGTGACSRPPPRPTAARASRS